MSGAKIHYLKSGTGKKTLVLIHGFGETSRDESHLNRIHRYGHWLMEQRPAETKAALKKFFND